MFQMKNEKRRLLKRKSGGEEINILQWLPRKERINTFQSVDHLLPSATATKNRGVRKTTIDSWRKTDNFLFNLFFLHYLL
jgi:hypothetical protein